MKLTEDYWSYAQSVAWTMLLEFRWFAKADDRANSGLSTWLRDEWRKRVEAGSTIDCMALARELEDQLRIKQRNNAKRLGLKNWEAPSA